MITWFENNPVGRTLGILLGVLVLISLFLGFVWSLAPSSAVENSGSDGSALTLDIPELGESEPLEKFAVITERPVFNQSRLPALADASDEEGDEDLLAEEEVDAPDFELAGVVITPTIRMVTLKAADQPQSLVAFEGQPLEGNYGTWQVSRIEAREITLSSDNGEEVQLALQVHDQAIEEPPDLAPEKSEEGSEEAPAAQEGDKPLSRAEEIRQRIAQRREELRRAAEENADGQGEEAAKEIDYRQAIQSMVSGRKEANEEEK